MKAPKPPKRVKAPEGDVEPWITPGKEYHVVPGSQFLYNTKRGYNFEIIDDHGEKIVCVETMSSHLGCFLDWIVTERED